MEPDPSQPAAAGVPPPAPLTGANVSERAIFIENNPLHIKRSFDSAQDALHAAKRQCVSAVPTVSAHPLPMQQAAPVAGVPAWAPSPVEAQSAAARPAPRAYAAQHVSQAQPAMPPPAGHVQVSAAGGPQEAGQSAAAAAGQAEAPAPAEEVYPVMPALVLKEASDKFKRFPADPELDAVQRAERIQDEAKMILPRSSLQRILERLGVKEQFQFSDETKFALTLLAESMLERTMDFGGLMAASRQSKWLEAKDMALYLERVWHIHLPGYGNRAVMPAPRVNPDSTGYQRMVSARQSLGNLQVEVPPSMQATMDVLRGKDVSAAAAPERGTDGGEVAADGLEVTGHQGPGDS